MCCSVHVGMPLLDPFADHRGKTGPQKTPLANSLRWGPHGAKCCEPGLSHAPIAFIVIGY